MKLDSKEMHGNYFLINGEIFTAEKYDPEIITKSTSVYEVIRIIDGVPLFLEEHIERLNQSFQLLDFQYRIHEKTIADKITKLIAMNQCYDYNVKVIVNNLDSSSPNTFIFFIESHYPTVSQYHYGVKAVLYFGERNNPNAKVVTKSFRQKIQEEIKATNAYEAILVNHHQQITEGSRSNIFVVKGNNLYTAPSEKVLKGVTRKRVIDLCKKMKLSVIEAPISINFLTEADGIFMTGTSPKVLPISKVNNTLYPSEKNPVIKKIIQAYDNLIENYIWTVKNL